MKNFSVSWIVLILEITLVCDYIFSDPIWQRRPELKSQLDLSIRHDGEFFMRGAFVLID